MHGKLPAYLSKDQHGLCHFRARIPKRLQIHFNTTEIKQALKANSCREAVKLARAYRTEFDQLRDEAIPPRQKKLKPLEMDTPALGQSLCQTAEKSKSITPCPEEARKTAASVLTAITVGARRRHQRKP